MTFGSRLRARVAGWSGRSRAVGLFFATSVSARAIGISCQLLQVPVAIKALGTEAFGLWMTLTGIATMIAFADFGVGQGAQNKLAEAFATERMARARELWNNTLVFFVILSLILAAGIGLAIGAADFTRLFHLDDRAVQAEAAAVVAATLGIFCL